MIATIFTSAVSMCNKKQFSNGKMKSVNSNSVLTLTLLDHKGRITNNSQLDANSLKKRARILEAIASKLVPLRHRKKIKSNDANSTEFVSSTHTAIINNAWSENREQSIFEKIKIRVVRFGKGILNILFTLGTHKPGQGGFFGHHPCGNEKKTCVRVASKSALKTV